MVAGAVGTGNTLNIRRQNLGGQGRVKRDTTTSTAQENSVEVLMILDYSIYYR